MQDEQECTGGNKKDTWGKGVEKGKKLGPVRVLQV